MTSGRTLQRFVASGVGEATWRTVIITVLLARKPKTCGFFALQNTKSWQHVTSWHVASCTNGFTIIHHNLPVSEKFIINSPVLCLVQLLFLLGSSAAVARWNLPTSAMQPVNPLLWMLLQGWRAAGWSWLPTSSITAPGWAEGRNQWVPGVFYNISSKAKWYEAFFEDIHDCQSTFRVFEVQVSLSDTVRVAIFTWHIFTWTSTFWLLWSDRKLYPTKTFTHWHYDHPDGRLRTRLLLLHPHGSARTTIAERSAGSRS